MTREEIFGQLRVIAASNMKVPAEEIREEMSILRDLGLDSLSIADLIISTEERFHFEFQEEDLHGLGTVGSLLDVIQARARG